jgi:tRNA A37 threonylcarbamoyladenosine synthetase subunit TsaC/SUA5/YrdC
LRWCVLRRRILSLFLLPSSQVYSPLLRRYGRFLPSPSARATGKQKNVRRPREVERCSPNGGTHVHVFPQLLVRW